MMKYANYWVFHQQRPKTNKIFLILLALFFQSALLHSQNLSAIDLDKKIAQDLVRLYNDSESTQRIEYLNSAIEQDPQNSDAYFLLATYEFTNENYYEAENLVKTSLNVNNWYYQFRSEAVYLHIQILHRQKRFQELYEMYANNDLWQEYQENPNVLVLLAEGVYRSGNNPSELLSEASSRYPSDMRFRLQSILYEDFPLISDYVGLATTYNIFERIIPASVSSEILSEEESTILSNTILYYLNITANDGASDLHDLYRSLSLSDPLINYFQNGNSIVNDIQSIIFIEESNAFDYITLLAMIENNVTFGVGSTSNISGDVILSVDLDRDREQEALLRYSNTQLASIELSPSAEIEQTIFFETQNIDRVLPQRIAYSDREQEIELVYSNYPDISRIRVNRNNASTVYELENSSYQPLIFLPTENNYSLNENLSRILKGRAQMSDLLIYLSLAGSPSIGLRSRAGVILNESASMQELVEQFIPNSFRQTITYANGHIEVQNFEDQTLLSSYFDYNGDGQFDAISIYEDSVLQFALRKINNEFIYSQFDSLGNNIESRIVLSNESFRLPLEAQNYGYVFDTDENQ